MHSARVYLRLARRFIPLFRTLRTTNSLCAPHSVTLSKIRPARREHFERTCRARMSSFETCPTRGRDNTCRPREFTERGCDKNSFSKSRTDCACSRCANIAPNIRLEYSMRDSPPTRERKREKESYRNFSRIELSRFGAPLFCLSCSICPGAGPLRRKFELGNSRLGAAW